MSSQRYINAASEYKYICILIYNTFCSATFYNDPPTITHAVAQELGPQEVNVLYCFVILLHCDVHRTHSPTRLRIQSCSALTSVAMTTRSVVISAVSLYLIYNLSRTYSPVQALPLAGYVSLKSFLFSPCISLLTVYGSA